MKITDLRAYVVRAQESRPWMFVEIDTDEGITGYGESTNVGGGGAIVIAQTYALAKERSGRPRLLRWASGPRPEPYRPHMASDLSTLRHAGFSWLRDYASPAASTWPFGTSKAKPSEDPSTISLAGRCGNPSLSIQPLRPCRRHRRMRCRRQSASRARLPSSQARPVLSRNGCQTPPVY